LEEVNAPIALSCENLSVSVGERTLVRTLSLDLRIGSMTAILGRNGAGKTLTLHTLAGLRPAAAGIVRLSAEPISSVPVRQRALRSALLLQASEDPFPSTVLETVLIGRHPHIDFWSWESAEDREIATQALHEAQLSDFANREVATLSGGERRRVAIATILAQNPTAFLLDEPLNYLDPHHQLDVLNLFAARAQRGHAVLMSLHDVGLAARFCERALLLFGDGEWIEGPVSEVLNEASMTRLYGVPMREIIWDSGRTFVAF
jgi:iron complex transport system ATP-binding protein